MKILWALVSLMLAGEVCAQCVDGSLQGEGQVLHARYQVFSEEGRHQVDFYRSGNQVAWQRGDVISVWKKEAESASLLRSFPGYERSIWYPAGDLRALGKETRWQGVTGWPQPEDAGFARVEGGDAVVLGCPVQAYQNVEYGQVLWLERVGVPARVADRTQQWQLVSLQRESMSDTFDRWRKWPSTDFADIGDNEADPFLRKMIALGFVEHGASGFYQADGKPMQGGPHHH
ncbi:hypothetical protein [Alcanivorax sp.]|jgi:hypothetical protein|uniref:hypothetical protein n=1 Tax=Alcanivorax sp. TaxID=1872427 RepID=UPI0032A0794B